MLNIDYFRGRSLSVRKVFEFFCANLERYLKEEDLVNIVDKKSGF